MSQLQIHHHLSWHLRSTLSELHAFAIDETAILSLRKLTVTSTRHLRNQTATDVWLELQIQSEGSLRRDLRKRTTHTVLATGEDTRSDKTHTYSSHAWPAGWRERHRTERCKTLKEPAAPGEEEGRKTYSESLVR